ncbi:MAG: LysR family transcriptional regulator [Deltaproteobacteria bacterium]|nr:LysR family transcriptional regulator [Deltaproteobacteria bacterium]
MHQIDFDLKQLEIFCKIVEFQSFTKAARAVALAQASVSERIAVLENSVGTRLLDRLGRKVVPTSAGKLLFKHAVALLEMKQMACMEMDAFLGIRKGEINLGASTIPGEYILPGIMVAFSKKHPLISIKLAISDSREIESRIIDGTFEMGVVGSKNSSDNLIYNKLWDDELVLAVSAGHRWSDKNSIFIQELSEEPFILREEGSGTLRIITDYFNSTSFDMDSLKTIARFGSSTAVKEGIKSGLGISVLSSRAIKTELDAGILKALKIENLLMTRNFYLIRDKRRKMSPVSNALLNFFLSKAANK